MLSFINSVQRRSVFMSAIITLGSGAVLGEALAGDHCPDTPFDFEDTWVADECDVCSISGEVLTCTLSTAHADNQMTVIEGYAASNAYSVFGVDDEDLFCCTYDNDDVDEAYDSITDIDVVGASSADLLAFRYPFATGTYDLSVLDNTYDLSATISGGAGADNIYGSDDSSLDYDETLYGGDHGDTINGNAGPDIIWGGDGVDVISGGAGADTIYGEALGDTIQGDAGNDTIDGGSGNDLIVGGTGDDYLVAGANADVLCGGGQSDELYTSDGLDKLWGYGGFRHNCSVGGSTIDDGSWTHSIGYCTPSSTKPTACP